MTSCPLADFSYLDMVDGIQGSENYQTSNRNVPCAEPAVEVGAGCTVGIAVVDIQIGEDVDTVAVVAVVVGIDVAGIEVAAGIQAVAGFEAVVDVDVVPAVKVDVGIQLVAVDSCRVGRVDAD